MLALALGLGSSLAWGVADFVAGLKSRRLNVVTVLLLSQVAGLVGAAAIVGVRGEGPPGGDFAVWAAVSSVVGLIGLTAFYRGLAVGAMSVVAPISATAALVPVTVGLATGERPSAPQVAGAALALAGVVLASREGVEAGEAVEAGAGGRMAAGTGLALVAALGFGCFFIAIDAASEEDVLWAILVNRIAGVSLLAAVALAVRPGLAAGREHLAGLIAVGVLDISANTLFAAASQEGLLSLVGIAGSLYPVVTVVLARVVLHERIARAQRAGVAATLVGVALITAGS